jgi:hypothetical protein
MACRSTKLKYICHIVMLTVSGPRYPMSNTVGNLINCNTETVKIINHISLSRNCGTTTVIYKNFPHDIVNLEPYITFLHHKLEASSNQSDLCQRCQHICVHRNYPLSKYLGSGGGQCHRHYPHWDS